MKGEGLNFSIATSLEERERAISNLGKVKFTESEWTALVKLGKARIVTTKETNGYRQHYERI